MWWASQKEIEIPAFLESSPKRKLLRKIFSRIKIKAGIMRVLSISTSTFPIFSVGNNKNKAVRHRHVMKTL